MDVDDIVNVVFKADVMDHPLKKESIQRSAPFSTSSAPLSTETMPQEQQTLSSPLFSCNGIGSETFYVNPVNNPFSKTRISFCLIHSLPLFMPHNEQCAG